MNASTPLVTVGIPTGGNLKNIRVAVQSLLEQTLTDWQGFVITEEELPEVESLVASFGDSRLHYAIAPNARQIPWPKYNYLMELVDTEFCAFLHDDDCYTPDYLQTMVAAFQQYPSAGWAFSNALYGELNSPETQYPKLNNFDTWGIDQHRAQYFMKLAVANTYLCFPTVMLRRRVYKSFPLKSGVREAADWQWELRMMQAEDCVYVGTPVYQYFLREQIKSYHYSGGLFLSELAIYSWLAGLPDLTAIRPQLLQMQQAKYHQAVQMLGKTYGCSASDITCIG